MVCLLQLARMLASDTRKSKTSVNNIFHKNFKMFVLYPIVIYTPLYNASNLLLRKPRLGFYNICQNNRNSIKKLDPRGEFYQKYFISKLYENEIF